MRRASIDVHSERNAPGTKTAAEFRKAPALQLTVREAHQAGPEPLLSRVRARRRQVVIHLREQNVIGDNLVCDQVEFAPGRAKGVLERAVPALLVLLTLSTAVVRHAGLLRVTGGHTRAYDLDVPTEPDTQDSQTRQQAGATRGARLVQAEFAAVLTRRRYCELVGIHATTLRRWEAAGVVTPTLETVMRIPTNVFDRKDVAFGCRLVEMLSEQSGRLSLAHAAAVLREQHSD